jgi:hypothetical protein
MDWGVAIVVDTAQSALDRLKVKERSRVSLYSCCFNFFVRKNFSVDWSLPRTRII